MEEEILEFELIKNGIITKYKYFGRTRSVGGMDLGIDVNFPDEMDKKGWYDNLVKETECMAAATLGYLIHTETDFSFNAHNSFSQLSAFNEKYLPDGYFSEPYFIDGDFGRFSDYGELAYPENNEDDDSYEFAWKNGSIRMKFVEKCCAGDWKNKIFINSEIEDEFKSHLKALIELFNPNSKV